jgi:hypothetical protein
MTARPVASTHRGGPGRNAPPSARTNTRYRALTSLDRNPAILHAGCSRRAGSRLRGRGTTPCGFDSSRSAEVRLAALRSVELSTSSCSRAANPAAARASATSSLRATVNADAANTRAAAPPRSSVLRNSRTAASADSPISGRVSSRRPPSWSPTSRRTCRSLTPNSAAMSTAVLPAAHSSRIDRILSAESFRFISNVRSHASGGFHDCAESCDDCAYTFVPPTPVGVLHDLGRQVRGRSPRQMSSA